MPAPTMTMQAEGAGQHRGRALDTQRDAALREATIELLAEIGYDRLTIDAVAARARSSKATIYRRWPGKAELVVDALHSLKGAPLLPDTGSLQGDLECIARGSASADNLLDAQLMMGLVSALTRDAELRRVFRERLIDPHTESLRHVFGQAVARGEVAGDRNLDLLVSVYPALMLRKLLMSGEMPDAHFAQQVINDVIVPLATAPGVSSPRPGRELGRSAARSALSITRNPEHTGGTTRGTHLGLALAVISAAQLMIVLDGTIVNVAVPTIHRSLHFSTGNLEWLITSYTLTFGGLLLFGGRTGDLYGKRRMFMTGIALFSVASLFGGLATSDVWLIVTRGIQGIGAAIASPTALSLIAANFPEGPTRNRAMGVYAAMSGAGGAVGLLLGGILTDLVSWRWIFFVNVPIGALVLFLAPRSLNESETTAGRLDFPGALTATGGMLSLVYGVSNASEHSWASLGTELPLALAAVLLAVFGVIETRSTKPLVPFRIFADRNRSGVYAMMLCIGTAVFSMFFFLTQFLQNVLGWSPIATGLGFLPMTAGIVVAASTSSRLVGRIGIRPPLLVGPAAIVIGLAGLTRLRVTSGYLDLIGPLVIIALGLGLSFVPLALTAVSGVRPSETGLASALLSTTQQVGGALGLAVLATIAISSAKSRLADLSAAAHGHVGTRAVAAATTHGYTSAFEVATCIALIGLVLSIAVIRPPNLSATTASTPSVDA